MQLIEVCHRLGLPSWWAESVLVEYTDWRKLGGESEIWAFDKSDIDEADLSTIASYPRVVIGGTIFHNVRREVLSYRMRARAASGVPVPLVEQPNDLIPEGAIGRNHVFFRGNDINAWDPKVGFGEYMQVLDEVGFWQWRVATFETVASQSSGRWVSNVVDLEPLAEMDRQMTELRSCPRMRRPSEDGYTQFVRELVDFYQRVDSIRAPIREALLEYHLRRRAEPWRDTRAATPPPVLSKFEDFRVEKGGQLLTRLHGEPLFFRECVRFAQTGSTTSSDVGQLDDIISARVQAIVNAAFCLEAVANKVGIEFVPHWKRLYGSLGIEGKWATILKTAGRGAVFEPGLEPYQSLGRIVELRNNWVHYDIEFRKVQVRNRGTLQEDVVTWIGARMDARTIRDLPQRVRDLVSALYEAIGQPQPAWLTSGPAWLL